MTDGVSDGIGDRHLDAEGNRRRGIRHHERFEHGVRDVRDVVAQFEGGNGRQNSSLVMSAPSGQFGQQSCLARFDVRDVRCDRARAHYR